MAVLQHAVDRQLLRCSLGLPDKIPPDFCGNFKDVMLMSRWPEVDLGVFDVTVTKSAGRRFTHRVFVHCRCGRLIPAGRMHQHVC